jgi:hypothetical protein
MKTIDEAAKEYASSQWGDWSLKAQERVVTKEDFKAGVEFAQRWYPVEEKPEEENGFYKPVLVLNEKYGMCCSAAYKNGLFIPDNPVIECSEITHWKPIELK